VPVELRDKPSPSASPAVSSFPESRRCSVTTEYRQASAKARVGDAASQIESGTVDQSTLHSGRIVS
jgi:hypothetical protein